MSRGNGRLLLLLLCPVLFNAADYLLTREALQTGFREANPFMKPVVHTSLFPVVKLGYVSLGSLLIWAGRRRLGTFPLLVAAVTCVYGLLMAYFIRLKTAGLL